MSDEYNSKTCITAGELRAIGVAIPAEVPDCGWVPRYSMTYGGPQVTIDNRRIHCTAAIRFSVPFQWIEVTGRVEAM